MADTTHRCPGPECERRVPAHMLACAPHWYQVPKALRDEVWSAYHALGHTADPVAAEERHDRAMHAAIETMGRLG